MTELAVVVTNESDATAEAEQTTPEAMDTEPAIVAIEPAAAEVSSRSRPSQSRHRPRPRSHAHRGEACAKASRNHVRGRQPAQATPPARTCTGETHPCTTCASAPRNTQTRARRHWSALRRRISGGSRGARREHPRCAAPGKRAGCLRRRGRHPRRLTDESSTLSRRSESVAMGGLAQLHLNIAKTGARESRWQIG